MAQVRRGDQVWRIRPYEVRVDTSLVESVKIKNGFEEGKNPSEPVRRTEGVFKEHH